MTTILRRRWEAVRDRVSSVPTWDDVVEAISAEADCSEEHANQFILWMNDVLEAIRQTGYEPYTLSDDDVSAYHWTLVTIAPDGQAARPGTAHHKMERLLVRPELGEAGLVHGNLDVEGAIRYCTVQVSMAATG